MARKFQFGPWFGVLMVSALCLVQAQQKQNPNFQGTVITVTENSQAQFNISRGGITWLEEVTDKEFAAQPIPKGTGSPVNPIAMF